MSFARTLRFALNLLLALALVAGPALAMPGAPDSAAAAALELPCHDTPPPPADSGCGGDCCADGACDPGSCRMAPALMVAMAAPLPAAAPPPLVFPARLPPPATAPLGVALRPPIA